VVRRKPRILLNCKDAFYVASGYGNVARNLTPRLADYFGKDNVLLYSPVYNRERIEDWNGIKVLPGTSFGFEDPILLEHYKRYDCSILLQVGDWFMLKQVPEWAQRDQIVWVMWAPFDFLNFPDPVREVIKYAARVVPFCQYAERRFREAGLENVGEAIWLGLDPLIWKPMQREKLPVVMSSLGFREDTFNMIFVQANQLRKYWREQLEGIKLFREYLKSQGDPTEVRMYLHTDLDGRAGERNLQLDLKELGLDDCALAPDPYAMACGGLTDLEMAAVFNCADVAMDALYEGFGYSMVQANAVGTPVIYLDDGPGPELAQYGVGVPVHHLDRDMPPVKPVAEPVAIANALMAIYEAWRKPGTPPAREKGIRWVRENLDWDIIAEQWIKTLLDVAAQAERYSYYQPQPSKRLVKKARQIVEV